jgi:hypothetical protein
MMHVLLLLLFFPHLLPELLESPSILALLLSLAGARTGATQARDRKPICLLPSLLLSYYSQCPPAFQILCGLADVPHVSVLNIVSAAL